MARPTFLISTLLPWRKRALSPAAYLAGYAPRASRATGVIA
ncbi:hypothetical protein QC820_12310 [Halomonas mongoliensis]|uniref:Uncharacterized protein n=1 Tax=Halomonas mongoliensis TaxID=321265 RepID=A0ABU1GQ90_9GAMM|nr:hypothetical protein [Halomonas mongoliensis]MDR5893593.1 hypothetical protein [Halomonas mongoliensis]